MFRSYKWCTNGKICVVNTRPGALRAHLAPLHLHLGPIAQQQLYSEGLAVLHRNVQGCVVVLHTNNLYNYNFLIATT